jgi:hypothetical protein
MPEARSHTPRYPVVGIKQLFDAAPSGSKSQSNRTGAMRTSENIPKRQPAYLFPMPSGQGDDPQESPPASLAVRSPSRRTRG